MIKSHLLLNDADRSTLESLVNKNSLCIRVYKRATALLKLDQGDTLQSVAALVDVNYNTVATWRDRYQAEGLAMLQDKPRSGRPPKLMASNAPKLPLWPVAHHPKAMPNGHYACWLKKPSNWILSNTFRIITPV